jgi:tetratricopeptide (TPR) repeat protein
VHQRILLCDGPLFQFAHPLIRHVFYADPSAARRQRIHLQIAQTLQRLYADCLDAHLLDIAHHLVRAGTVADTDTVVAYARRAGDQAFRVFAWGDAASYYEAALAAAESSGRLSIRDRAELHYWAGRAHHRDQDAGPCLAHYEQAAEAYRLVEDVRGLARVLMEKAEIQYTLASVPLGTLPDMQPLEGILAALGEGEPALRGQIFAIMAQVYRNARQGDKAEAMARRALDIGQRLGDQHLCARASSALALAHLNSGQIKEALESYRSARSARSLVGSTPSSTTNVHRPPISRSRVRANFPASSCRFGDHQFGIFDLLPNSPPCGNGCSPLLLANDDQRRQRDGFEAIPVRAAIA